MPFNIDNVRIVKNVGPEGNRISYISASDVARLQEIIGDDMPENCFLRDIKPDTVKSEKIYLGEIDWGSECSGRSFHYFEEHVVPTIKGEIVALVTWEEGERTEIWHIKDGQLEQLDLMNILKNPKILAACLTYDQGT